MRYAWLYSLAGIFIGIAVPFVVFSHSSGCHSWHSCPSDSGTYVCGDKGKCSQCPDNQYCSGGSPRSAPSSSVETPPPSPPPPSSPETQETRVLPPPVLLLPQPPASPPPAASAPAEVNSAAFSPPPIPALPTPSSQATSQTLSPPPSLPKTQPQRDALKNADIPVPNPAPPLLRESAAASGAENLLSPYLFLAASILIGLIAAGGFLLFRL